MSDLYPQDNRRTGRCKNTFRRKRNEFAIVLVVRQLLFGAPFPRGRHRPTKGDLDPAANFDDVMAATLPHLLPPGTCR